MKRLPSRVLRELELKRCLAYLSPTTKWLFWKRLEVMEELAELRWKKDFSSLTVLDVGCGAGLFLPSLCEHADLVLGLDRRIDPETFLLLKKFKCEDLCLLEHDLTQDFPLKSRSVDVLFCADVLEHLESVEKTLEEISRVLKVGGELLVSNPSDSPLYEFLTYFTGFKRQSQKEAHLQKSRDLELNLRRKFKLIEKRRLPWGLDLFSILKLRKVKT